MKLMLVLLLALSADPRPVMSALERMPVHVSDRGEDGRRARLSLIASAVERILRDATIPTRSF